MNNEVYNQWKLSKKESRKKINHLWSLPNALLSNLGKLWYSSLDQLFGRGADYLTLFSVCSIQTKIWDLTWTSCILSVPSIPVELKRCFPLVGSVGAVISISQSAGVILEPVGAVTNHFDITCIMLEVRLTSPTSLLLYAGNQVTPPIW